MFEKEDSVIIVQSFGALHSVNLFSYFFTVPEISTEIFQNIKKVPITVFCENLYNILAFFFAWPYAYYSTITNTYDIHATLC